MFRTAKLVSVAFVALLGACIADEDSELGIDEAACDDDTKCDGVDQQGFEIFKGADGKYYFHVVSKNGKITMRSQAYTTRASAVTGVESVRTNGVDPASYKLLQARNGEWYINLYARNHEVIATSETFGRKFNAQRSLEGTRDLIATAQQIRAASTSGARFQTFKGTDHKSYFHLRAKNGEVLLQSQGYINASSAIASIASVREHGKTAGQYTLLEAVDGQWYFTLKSTNGQVIARGETYATKSNATRARDAIVALLRSELVANPRSVAAPARSIATSQSLVQALDAMSDVADAGQAYFGVAEQATKPADATCEDATAAQALESYDRLVIEVFQNGDASARPDMTQAQIAAQRTQLAQVLGSDAYRVCTREVAGEQFMQQETFLLSQQSTGPRIVLDLGFEQQ
jgi:uncharacterized protein YegP (UPF0339 family)